MEFKWVCISLTSGWGFEDFPCSFWNDLAVNLLPFWLGMPSTSLTNTWNCFPSPDCTESLRALVYMWIVCGGLYKCCVRMNECIDLAKFQVQTVSIWRSRVVYTSLIWIWVFGRLFPSRDLGRPEGGFAPFILKIVLFSVSWMELFYAKTSFCLLQKMLPPTPPPRKIQADAHARD